MLRESGKVWSEGFGKPPGGLSELGPTEHLLYGCRHAFSVEPLGSQENAGAGPLKGLHVQVLVHVAREPDHRHPGRQRLLRRRAAAVAEHHGGARCSRFARQVVRDEGVGRHVLQVVPASGGRDHRHG